NFTIWERRSVGFDFISPDGTPLLARPFVNAISGANGADLVAAPGIFSGVVTGSTGTKLYSGENNLLINLWRDCGFRADAYLGGRYIDLNEYFNMDEFTRILPGGAGTFPNATVNTGDAIVVSDRFTTLTKIYLAQVGGRAEWTRGPLTLS